MNKNAGFIYVGLAAIFLGITATTVGHYASMWEFGYVISLFGGLLIALAAQINS